MKRFKTKKREGSICTKLGLTEVNEDKKESLNKQSRKLSHKNSGKKNIYENKGYNSLVIKNDEFYHYLK